MKEQKSAVLHNDDPTKLSREGTVQVRDAISGTYYLPLRNPSGMAGITITVEVVAVVREVVK
jgi:hypothetical protein